MAGSCTTPLSRTSNPPTDPLLHPDPPYSAPNPASSPRLPAARLSEGALSSGRVPLNVNETSGGGAAAPDADCKLVEVRGMKVASFTVSGAELICLPQVFQLFLKHLVGGLHTVYTKLKRLRIHPVVCTVEQVRVLRGLGAIQPGVNRCKLITRADFDTLYRDCTNASSRPGRPPKRSLGVATMTNCSRLLPHGLISPALLSQTGLTVAVAEALKLQKVRMMTGCHGIRDQRRAHGGMESESEDTAAGSEASWDKELHLLSPSPSVAPPPPELMQQHSTLLANRLTNLPFMVMPHPLLPVEVPPAGVAMAMNRMSQLSSLAAMSQIQREEIKLTDTPPGSPSPCPSLSDDGLLPGELTSRSPSLSSSSSSPPAADTPELMMASAAAELSMKKLQSDEDGALLPLPLIKPINHVNSALTPFLLAEGLSSMETLLTNIQGLLKVAVQSARSQIKQSQTVRKELKLELERERGVRQTLQRQLSSELHTRESIQRRLKREKKAKRKLQEALDFESRRRERVQRELQVAVIPECELDEQLDDSTDQERRPFNRTPLF